MTPETQETIPSSEDCYKKMSELARSFLRERNLYGELRTEKRRTEAKLLRLIQEGDFTRWESEEARRVLRLVVEEGRLNKMTIADKRALCESEMGSLYEKYEAAKFKAETSQNAFEMYNSMAIWHMSRNKSEDTFGRYST